MLQWRIVWRIAAAALTPALPTGAAAAADNAADKTEVPIPCEAVDSVGTAKMSADGTITLRVRSLWPQPYAENQLVYAPGNARYGEIKRHLGGIAPGETKPVPPWCGTNSEP